MPSIEGVQFDERSRLPLAVVTACTLLCVLHLLTQQLGETAPLRGASDPQWPARVAVNQFDRADQLFREVAAGHNLQLAIDPNSMSNPVSQATLTLLYFRSVYAVFPHRVFVGHGDRVINNGPQLHSAGDTPDADWLRSHDVKNVLQLGMDGDGNLRVQPRAVQ